VSTPYRRIIRYAPWQLLDYLVPTGLTAIAIGMFLGLPLYMMTQGGVSLAGNDPAASMEATVAGTLAFLLVLLAVQRLVAGDRTAGYSRFYFAKPVSPVAFYLQKLVMHGVGLLLVTGVLWLLAAMAGVTIHGWALLASVALAYVTLGGLAFLCSTVTRFDWTVVVVVWLAAALMRVLFFTHGLPLWPLRLLPPTQELDLARVALFSGATPPVAAIAWPLGYGVVATLLGLVILSRRPLAS